MVLSFKVPQGNPTLILWLFMKRCNMTFAALPVGLLDAALPSLNVGEHNR